MFLLVKRKNQIASDLCGLGLIMSRFYIQLIVLYFTPVEYESWY